MVLDLSVKEKQLVIDAMSEYALGFPAGHPVEKLRDKIKRSIKQIKPRSAKDKGATWQKSVCELISRIIGLPFDNQDDNCSIHSRTMGCSGSDVELRGEARKRFPFGVECKNSNQISLPDWCRQAKSNAIDGRWLLFIKSAKLEENVVVMTTDVFEEVMKK